MTVVTEVEFEVFNPLWFDELEWELWLSDDSEKLLLISVVIMRF